jgi:hypothetical protein
MEINLKEFGIVPIEIRKNIPVSKYDTGISIYGEIDNKCFNFMIDSEEEFIKNKNTYIESILKNLKELKK